MKQIIPLIFMVLMGLWTSGCLCDDDECVTVEDREASSSIAELNIFLSWLCDAAERCDPSLADENCYEEMRYEEGAGLWPKLGLADGTSRQLGGVQDGIDAGLIRVDHPALAACQHELVEACDNEGESFDIGRLSNVKNLILENGACSTVLSSDDGGVR